MRSRLSYLPGGMAAPWVSQESNFARLAVALRETGVPGVTRRATRQALLRVRDGASRLATRLFYAEAERRLPRHERELAARCRELAGSERGRAAFVLGTAPSLNKYDLSHIAGHVTIGVNGFFRHPIMSVWQPTHYVLMDGAFFDDPSTNHPFFEALREVTPDTKFLIPASEAARCRAERYLPDARTYHFVMDGSLDDGAVDDLDLARFIPGLLNSVQLGIGLAMHLGCSPIHVMGADHDWLARNCQQNLVDDPHFYQGQTLARKPRKEDADPFHSYLVLIDYCRKLWRSYEVLDAIARRRGQQILVSKESYLDVFPAFDYEQWAAARPPR